MFLTKGKRGKIYLDGSIATKKSEPVHSENEVKWLKILNQHNIGPKFISHKKDQFSYTFVKGIFLPEYTQKNTKTKIIKILKQVLLQCRTMDKLKVNKLEMHNPYKHIVITNKNKPVLIDFERCYQTAKPKNVTQFCQYMASNKYGKLLKQKNINITRKEIIPLTKKYKKTYQEQNFKKILSVLNTP